MATRTTRSGATIDDSRTPDQHVQTSCYVVATDSFMSGWGMTPGRSYYAVACESYSEAMDVRSRMSHRSDFKRVRIVLHNWRPRLHSGDHLAIRPAAEFTYRPSSGAK